MRTLSHAQKIFNKWRHEYNTERPHEALDLDFPINRYIASTRRMPSSLPSIEYHTGAVVRKVRGNGFISYNGTEYLTGEAFKNFYIEVKHDEMNNCIDLYFGDFKIYNYDC